MCTAQHFECIISLNPRGDPRGEIWLFSFVACEGPEKGYSPSKLMQEHTARTWWSQDLNLSNLTPRFTWITTLNSLFPKYRIPRQPHRKSSPGPTLFNWVRPNGAQSGYRAYQNIDKTPARSFNITQHPALIDPGQVSNCKDKPGFILSPFISPRAEFAESIPVWESAELELYFWKSSRDDTEDQLTRCGCPKAEAGRARATLQEII